MSTPSPPPRDPAEDRAISEAIHRDEKKQKAANAASKPKQSLLVLIVAAGVVAVGAYYGLNYLNRNDDLEPIRLPEPAQPIPTPLPAPHKPKLSTPGKASPGEPSPGAKPAESKSHDPGTKVAPRLGAETTALQGLLAVTCNPECEIEIDGHPTGKRSPQAGLVLPAGAHKLRLVNRQVHLSTTDSVSIAADQTTTRHYNLVRNAK